MTRRELLAVPLAGAVVLAEPEWEPLISGGELKGWRQEGRAVWSESGGVITGRQGPGGAAGDLLTEKQWSDFELELEWRMRWPGNSGIWFRYASAKAAYQADILDQASHPGVLSGSLYCMGKAFIAENRDAASVDKDGWNRLRIEVEGEWITIEQNGRRVIRVRDATYPGPGSVGIQLHAGKAYEGMEIRVRGMRIRARK